MENHFSNSVFVETHVINTIIRLCLKLRKVEVQGKWKRGNKIWSFFSLLKPADCCQRPLLLSVWFGSRQTGAIYCHCNCHRLSMRPITINNVLLSHFYKQFISTLDMTENRFHWFTGTIFSLTSQVQGAIFFTSWVYIDTPLHPVVESNSKCRDGQKFWLHYLREQDNCQVYITIQDVVTAHKKKQNWSVSNHWPKNLHL